jgi:hypothetical protein
MNAARYLSYKHTLGLIEGLDPEPLSPGDTERLRELAQDMLLTRGDDPDYELVEDGAAMVSELLGSGAVEPEAADELWKWLCACGPRAVELIPAV